MRPIARRLKDLLADIRPLQESAAYRRLWAGQTVSMLGSQMTAVALPIQVYGLTHSSLAVGGLGIAFAGPLIILGLLGGSFADAVDRRKLVLATGSLLVLVSLAFAAQALAGLREVWLLYILYAVQSSLIAVDNPARRTFIPRLLGNERIPAAWALSILSMQLTRSIGPLIAGLVIAAAGLRTAYLIDALSFVIGLYAVARLPSMRVHPDRGAMSLRAVTEGLRYLRDQPVLKAVLVADVNAMVFGMPLALFPALAATHFGGGPQTVGILYASPAIGGLVCASFSGAFTRMERQGMAILVSIGIWGAAIAGFSVSRLLWLAVTLLAVAGAADVVSTVFRSTMVQLNTPDELQGRVNSVNFIVGAGGPRVGDVEAGAVATLTSPVISAVSGGLASIAGVILLAVLSPALRRYKAKEAETERVRVGV